MSFFEFQKFSFNHIFFLLYFISSFARQRFKDLLFDKNAKISGTFYTVYIGNISHFLTIIPLLITNYLFKNSKEKNKKGPRSIKYIYYNKITKFNSKGKLKSMFLVSIFDFLAEVVLILFYFINNKEEVYSYYSLRILLLFNTIMQYIASYFILTNILYSHHYLSLSINFFCVIIFLIIDVIKIIENSITDYQYYILCFVKLLRLAFFCIGDNYIKYALYSEMLSPYSIELYKAIYKNIFLIIFSIPFIFLKTNDIYIESSSVFTGFIFYFQGIKILYTFCFIILHFLYDLFLVIIIDRFSPNHLTLAYMLESFGSTIYNIIEDYINKGNTDWLNYFNFLIYIFVFIGAMIYNEVLIINKCGLNMNTILYMNDKFNKEKEFEDIISNDDANDINDDNDNTDENSSFQLEHSFA